MSNTDQLYKLILTYDVNAESLQAYYEFVMGKFVPAMQEKGLRLMEAWTKMYGDVPNRHIVFVSDDLDSIMEVLDDESWDDYFDKLHEFAEDIEYKVVPYREGIQI